MHTKSATNFLLVRMRNPAIGHSLFARTHNFSTMSVATGGTTTGTDFDIFDPTTSRMQFGDSTMVTIANGVQMNTVGIIVEQ